MCLHDLSHNIHIINMKMYPSVEMGVHPGQHAAPSLGHTWTCIIGQFRNASSPNCVFVLREGFKPPPPSTVPPCYL